MDFPAGPVVKNLPTNARDLGLIPALGRFHMPQGNLTFVPQLLRLGSSPRSAITEAHVPQEEKPLQWEAWALQLESSPHLTQLEKAHAQQQDPAHPKTNKFLIKKWRQ